MLPDVFPLGPFIVQPGGRLAFRVPDSRPAFRFAWRGRWFLAVLGTGTLQLSGVVGQVPSTLVADGRRSAAFALLARLPRGRPAGWAFRLAPDHRVEVTAEETLDWPATAASLMQPLIRFLLRLAPYLDVLEENGCAAAAVRCP